MWTLGLLTGLMLTSFCLADTHNISPKFDAAIRALEESYEKLQCGNRKFADPSLKRSYGQAEPGEFPWLVNIILSRRAKFDRCDGTLIHPNVVLTAAHCVHEKNLGTIEVIAGQWNRRNTSESVQRRAVKEVIIAEDFELESRQNNFALLIFQRPFVLNEKVGVVCLLDVNMTMYIAECIASGWAKYSDTPTKVAPLFANDRETCLEELQIANFKKFDSSSQCTDGDPRMDKCKGNFGTPLACPLLSNSRRYYLVAFLSWIPECSSFSGPAVWSRIDKNRIKWIKDKLANYQYSLVGHEEL